MIFFDCPAWPGEDSAVRCGLPAEVRCRFTVRSADGPIEGAMIRCPDGHWFNGPIESLTWAGKHAHDPGTAGAAAGAKRGKFAGSHDGPDGEGRYVSPGNSPRAPYQQTCGPNGAPAYYLGRPARLWITAMRRRRALAARG
jgi:hypothetical protein